MADDFELRSEIEQWLIEATGRSGTEIEGSRPQRIRSWRSRTATLHLISWTDSALPDMVAKIYREPAEAAVHFHSMAEVSERISAGSGSRLVAIDPVAVSEDLGVVVMPYVPGEHLADLLVSSKWSTMERTERLPGIVGSCGNLLGRYHAGAQAVTEETRRAAYSRLQSRIERVLGRPVELTGLTVREPIVKSYRDFHPGHIIVTPDGNVAAIDPPVKVRYDYFYRDLAFFAHSLFLALIDPRGLRSAPLRIRHKEHIVAAFLNGYTTTTDRPLTSDDLFFINSWEAFYLTRMLQKIRRRRSLSQWVYYYAPLRTRLRELVHSMERHIRGVTP